jgi:hypothetical protein
MKKIVLSLAGVLVATAFAPEASALPLFARQTGRACNSCHYQHFPLLTAVGQDFKNSGFTQINGKGKFKGEDLSIPDNLNLGVYTTTYFQTQAHGQTAGVDNGADPTLGKWGVPGTGGELSLFLGGRVSDFAGFLAEAGLGDGAASVGPAKLVMLFPVGDARIGTVIFTSPDQGAAYSFETLNTGAVGVHKMMGNGGPSNQHVNAAYAAQYLGTATAATGLSVVANGGLGFINVAAYEMAGNNVVTGANNLNLTYIRAASTMNFGDWEAGFGIQNFGGKSTVTGGLVSPAGQYNAPKATIIDGQLQGNLGAMPVGFYVSYGTASASTTDGAGNVIESNPLNPCGAAQAAAANAVIPGSVVPPGTGTPAPGTAVACTKSANTFNVAAEFGVVPHTTIQVAMRLAKNGADTNGTDNALMLGVSYALAQNILLSFHHTQQSGSAWNTDATGYVRPGKDANTLLLQTSF